MKQQITRMCRKVSNVFPSKSTNLDQVDGNVGLPELHVAAGPVNEDLDPVEAHVDVGTLRVPKLLTDLNPDAGVNSGLEQYF